MPFPRMGNRDINKMRLTSEYTDQELALLSPESPAAYWVPEARLAYEGHYRRVELLSLCNKERQRYIYIYIFILYLYYIINYFIFILYIYIIE
jgi:hypothetical protein